MTAAFLGIDIGTSSCKALLLGVDGGVIGTQSSPYDFEQPREGWAEQNPRLWKDGASNAVRALLSEYDVELLCVGLSGQMHGMTALSSDDQVLRPAILWNDQRNAAECAEITELAGGIDALVALVGNQMLPGFTGGKIRWFSKHEPDAFDKTRMILNPKDYIRFLLTGEKVTEVTDASGTGLFDVTNRRWSDELFDRIELDKQLLPQALESSEISGQVTELGETLFGIPSGTPVVGGGGDAIVQTLGSGVIAPGRLQTTIGTAGIVAAAADMPLPNKGGHIQMSCNVLPDKWHFMGVSLNAGSALAWWRDLQFSESGVLDYEDLSSIAGQAGIGADGLLFLPYLMGERCPWPDPDARGAFVGLRSNHSLAQMHRAVFEGIVFSLRDMALLVDPQTADKDRVIHASGGGSSSDFWNQMQADVFGGAVVTTLNSTHGGAFGAAILAGIGAGHWSGSREIAVICKEERRWNPETSAHTRYSAYFDHYRTLHEALRSANHGLSNLQTRAP